MLRLWACWFQGAGRASRWRFLTVSWKWHCTWQIAGLSYRNESTRAFLKSWSCGLTGIILFLRVKTLRSIQLWKTDRRQEEEKKNTEEEEWHLEYVFWPLRGQAARVEVYVLGPLLEIPGYVTSFPCSSWQNLSPLFPAPSLTLFLLVWEWLHGGRQCAEWGPGHRLFTLLH